MSPLWRVVVRAVGGTSFRAKAIIRAEVDGERTKSAPMITLHGHLQTLSQEGFV
eukprot:jgi/Psemu1/301304/fgenesh1_kg.30_\